MSVKIVATNRKARFNYDIKEKYEAGIELKGTEVKSIRKGKINISDGFASIDSGECYLKQVHISPYEQGNIFNVDPMRVRKLLLHKSEINYLIGQTMQKGFSLIPLSVYFKNGRVKVEIGLCQGKKNYDKRHDMAKKDADMKIKRAIKEFNNR
ncbi:SsrA-binding protein [Peptoanaerobacter stomatis]|jgi:ssrA-binding protein|uniref:SsrA-binding protein n=1 Tax=Peptoanaerobacter stomatis TaxID=796937 RepID=G9XB14_9FIRM|nr:SsrA-binding protein SmpB [Peptoanaerobacter stomatis]NWO25880.1 SsrA-binding protein SmpB [Peptostreptococcaceae bacterium oral taxon 081]EHL09974.1 SsrA-binding protein [Peptoanaerobacter stomatis]EHL17998.1 SsrA-binding protein [Peptoanaerobacter stomatis]EHL19848.1 SsrA-binding protein [Peptoanaerobacter stomatis]EJU24538.1 SsrA-binding protein [Peptoanaerobacter stomatis]